MSDKKDDNKTRDDSDIAKTNIEKLEYEEASHQLEQILETLESGELPLEQSLALYELGANLAAHCAKKLDEAELRVRKWQSDAEVVSFNEWAEG